MPSPDDILEGLPPPSSFDDEPATLRRDILDELSDHLECAVQRELRHSDDPAIARQSALQRFGNPRQIARRLWLDAMKGQLMNQRIMIGTQVLMIIVIAVLCITFLVSLRQNQKMQEAMLARIEAISAAGPHNGEKINNASFDWPTFRTRVLDQAGKSGLAGVKVSFFGEAYNQGEKLMLNATTDSTGEAVFGPLRPGGYELKLPGGGDWKASRKVAVPPGPERPALEIRSFDPPAQPVKVALHLATGSLATDLPWVLALPMNISARNQSSDESWTRPQVTLFFRSDGRVVLVPDFYSSGSMTNEEVEALPWSSEIELDASSRYHFQQGPFMLQIDSAGSDDYRVIGLPSGYSPQFVELSPTSNPPIEIQMSGETSQIMQQMIDRDTRTFSNRPPSTRPNKP